MSFITSARRLCNHLGLYVCVCVCVYVCLSVNTITQKIINIWKQILHIHLPLPKEELIKFWCNLVEN